MAIPYSWFSFTGNGQNSEPAEPANGHQDEGKAGAFRKGPDGDIRGYDNNPEDSQDPAVVAEGSLGLGGVGNIIKLLRVSQSLEENRNSSDRKDSLFIEKNNLYF